MTAINTTDDLFFEQAGLDRDQTEKLVEKSLDGADDGELFLEYRQSEAMAWDDGRLKSASFDTTQGFGLRAIAGEATGYSHSTELSEAALKRASETVRAVHAGHDGEFVDPPSGTNRQLYSDDNPLAGIPFETKVKTLEEIDAYARAKDPRVKQVSASLAGSWQAVRILRGDGRQSADIRPLVRLNVSVVCGDGDRMEAGSYGAGGRTSFDAYLDPAQWHYAVD
ncbi:MAG: DNA gyrase modulator, partial [Pseudomonadota bacterium]